MSVDILKLKTLAEAAQRDQHDHVALNDYGMAVPPTTVLELIAEIERHSLVEAEGCKPESSILHLGVTTAARDVLAERQRQIEVEGYSPEQDDKYARGDLADAGSVYAFWANTPSPQASNITPPCWPWAPEYWKPTNQRDMLIKAGALILAEIERLDRLQAREVLQ